MIIKEYEEGILRSLYFFYSYMIDAADREKIEASRNELHNLLDKPQLQGIPVSMDDLLFYIIYRTMYLLYLIYLLLKSYYTVLLVIFGVSKMPPVLKSGGLTFTEHLPYWAWCCFSIS